MMHYDGDSKWPQSYSVRDIDVNSRKKTKLNYGMISIDSEIFRSQSTFSDGQIVRLVVIANYLL